VDFQVIKEIALIADRNGYNSIGVHDHLYSPQGSSPGGKEMPERFGHPVLEGWTTLSALTTITSRARLTNAVLCNLFRYPSVLAKMASTLDVISNGRFNLAIGAGWFKGECKAYGIPWRPYETRLEMLRESVQLIKRLWTEQEVTFSGKHYQLEKAVLNPKPVQKPHPPIILGGSSENVMKLAVEEADGWDVDTGMCPFEVFKQRFVLLDDYCSEVGRKVSSIRISVMTTPFLAKSLSEAKKLAAIWAEYVGRDPEEYVSSKAVWLGTAQDMVSSAEKWFEAGVNQINFLLPHDVQYARNFTREMADVVH
jgi:alkanesulfonate monooxygenase SsuD/methylene tetrahydromethanopterin reductase-like flavin-dependent oxidoreductase (luciferase family)